MIHDTIAAIATPPGMGGIGIIRISGHQALPAISGLFGNTLKGPMDCRYLESHRVIHGYIFHPQENIVLDEVLVIPMLAPRSYTRETVVEIHAHAGPMVMRAILECIITQGIRLAEPGEFTKRAFLNNRIDLTQAEAISDIICARSTASMKMAAAQSTGKLKETITHAREMLISLLTLIEAAIDFPDEGEDLISEKQFLKQIDGVIEICNQGIKTYDDGHFLRDGIKLAICGPPNVGKSSLMNCLLESERSIVTAIPGTTRDLIEEGINIDGVPFVISDTAGMHDTKDPVEQIGIKKAMESIARSDMVLFMKTAGEEISAQEIRAIAPTHEKVIIVFNKMDLMPVDFTPQLPENLQGIPHALISARRVRGIQDLKKQILAMSAADQTDPTSVVPNLRHKIALEQTKTALDCARQNLTYHREEETLAIDIRMAAESLGKITGATADIDILDKIFSQFCIGK